MFYLITFRLWFLISFFLSAARPELDLTITLLANIGKTKHLRHCVLGNQYFCYFLVLLLALKLLLIAVLCRMDATKTINQIVVVSGGISLKGLGREGSGSSCKAP